MLEREEYGKDYKHDAGGTFGTPFIFVGEPGAER